MNLFNTLQGLSFLLSIGYLEYGLFTAFKNQLYLEKQTTKNHKKLKDYYDFCNSVLLELLKLKSYDHYDFSVSQTKNPEIHPNDYIKNIYHFNQYPELKPLIFKLINYINPSNLDKLATNITDLELQYKRTKQFSPGYNPLGEYYISPNLITMYTKGTDILSHEFLHMASSITTDNATYSGFYINNDIAQFFSGLNEGYTELLNQRIFGAKFTVYKTNCKICEMLELMFQDKSDLENAYFTNDVDTFIETFLQYGNIEELNFILKEMDHFAHVPFTKKEVREVTNLIYEIISRKKDYEKILQCENLLNKPINLKTKSFVKKLVK